MAVKCSEMVEKLALMKTQRDEDLDNTRKLIE